MDLGALNIMRGRDNGIPDYNTVREMFDLDRVVEWNQINPTMYFRNGEVRVLRCLHEMFRI